MKKESFGKRGRGSMVLFCVLKSEWRMRLGQFSGVLVCPEKRDVGKNSNEIHIYIINVRETGGLKVEVVRVTDRAGFFTRVIYYRLIEPRHNRTRPEIGCMPCVVLDTGFYFAKVFHMEPAFPLTGFSLAIHRCIALAWRAQPQVLARANARK